MKSGVQELEKTVDDFIVFYKSMRLHRKLHDLSPDQIERSFFAEGTNEAVWNSRWRVGLSRKLNSSSERRTRLTVEVKDLSGVD